MIDQETDSQIASSAETTALFEYLREATEHLEVINRIIAAINSSRTIDEVFRPTSEHMRALVPFDRASIALCDHAFERLRVFALSGERASSLVVGATAPLHGSVTETALREHRVIVIPELRLETRFNVHEDLEREGFRSAVCCPLFSTRGAVGSLNLTSLAPHVYQREHVLALERLGPPFAIAIEKVLLLEQAERRSAEMEETARREELASKIGRQLASSLNPASILQDTIDELGRVTRSDRCHLSLFEENSEYALVDYEYRAHARVTSLRGNRLDLRGSRHAWRALESDEPVVLDHLDENEDSELRRLYQRCGVRTILAASVTVSGERAGLLELHDHSGARRWTPGEIKLLKTIAAQISVALTNANLYEASRRRGSELEGLYEISRAFSAATSASDIYGRLTRSIAELVGAEKCMLATYDRRRRFVRAHGPGYQTPPEMIEAFQFTLGQSSGAAIAQQTGAGSFLYNPDEPAFSNDPTNDTRFDWDFLTRHGIRSVLIAPMLLKGELVGFIYAANRPGGFRPRDAQLLQIFAAQAAETIANARLFLTIQAQAEREAVVNRLLLTLQQTTDPRQGAEVIVERVGEVLELDRCIATLFSDHNHSEFGGEWCAPGVRPVRRDRELLDRSPIAYWMKMHRRPLAIDDLSDHPMVEGYRDLVERTGLRSLAIVPIMYRGRVIGAVCAHQTRRLRRWTEDDKDLLSAVAIQVGSALENARLIEEFREASRLKDDFLATLSHELRTPLTAIKGWVDLLSEHPLMDSDEEMADGINVIKHSANSLTQLINDLLDLSRIQRRGLELDRKSSDINQSVIDAVQTLRPTAIARRLDLRPVLADNLPRVEVDPGRIQQVFWNLLTNAIKFTPEGGQITVQTRLFGANTPEGHIPDDNALQWIEIEVRDSGEGIAPDFLPHVWDRFRQADGSSTRRHGGLGIGLALVKELVDAHDGEVQAESDGKGAIFTVRLPVSPINAGSERVK